MGANEVIQIVEIIDTQRLPLECELGHDFDRCTLLFSGILANHRGQERARCPIGIVEIGGDHVGVRQVRLALIEVGATCQCMLGRWTRKSNAPIDSLKFVRVEVGFKSAVFAFSSRHPDLEFDDS